MVDKTMMGDKCAELVRAAMIGALAVTLSNPTAVYAAEEETADPGQIGIEIAGEAAVGAASFDVEENVAEPEEPQPDGTEDMPEKEDATNPEKPQDPDSGADAGTTEPGEADSGELENPDSKNDTDMPETPGSEGNEDVSETEGDEGTSEKPGNSEIDGPWPGEGEDISNDPWPGQEEIRRKKKSLSKTEWLKAQEKVPEQMGTVNQRQSHRILSQHSRQNRRLLWRNPFLLLSRKPRGRGKITVHGSWPKPKRSQFPACHGCSTP